MYGWFWNRYLTCDRLISILSELLYSGRQIYALSCGVGLNKYSHSFLSLFLSSYFLFAYLFIIIFSNASYFTLKVEYNYIFGL